MLCALLLTAAEAIPAATIRVHVVSGTPRTSLANGSAAAPFATLSAAAAHVRHLRSTGAALGEVIVTIGAGAYAPISLDESDSGRDAMARTNYRGEGLSTIVSGGVEVPPHLFHANEELAVEHARELTLSSNTIFTADLESLGISDEDLGSIIAGPCVHGCPDMPSGLSFQGHRMTLARWPDVEASTGHNVYTHAANGCGPGCLELDKSSAAATRAHRWVNESGWLHGYFEWDWADCYRQLSSLNATGGGYKLSFEPATEAPKANARFYVTNLLSELTAPGEFFLERSAGARRLHLIPPGHSALMGVRTESLSILRPILAPSSPHPLLICTPSPPIPSPPSPPAHHILTLFQWATMAPRPGRAGRCSASRKQSLRSTARGMW